MINSFYINCFYLIKIINIIYKMDKHSKNNNDLNNNHLNNDDLNTDSNNNINTLPKMYGVVDGIYFNHKKRDNELNERISIRNVPSSTLQPQFSPRPTSSKYDMMPIFDRRQKPTVQIRQEPIFNNEAIFNPGTAQAPWQGFSSNINVESSLRNQFFALQKSDQVNYVPSRNSDLYNTHVKSQPIQQPFPGLFKESNLASFNPNKYNVATDMFYNNTRAQYKNININNKPNNSINNDNANNANVDIGKEINGDNNNKNNNQ